MTIQVGRLSFEGEYGPLDIKFTIAGSSEDLKTLKVELNLSALNEAIGCKLTQNPQKKIEDYVSETGSSAP